MEHHHREAIQKNYSILVQECRIDDLLPVLLHKQVFSKQMIKKYKEIPDEIKRKRELFLDIQTRGPRAFLNLVTSLGEIGQNYLANALDPNAANHVIIRKHVNPFILPTNTEDKEIDPVQLHSLAHNNANKRINLNTTALKVKVKLSTEFYDGVSDIPTYSTHSKKRGAVLIINVIKYINDIHLERKGAEVDGKNLNDLFLQMGLTVEYHINLTNKEIINVIHEFKSSSRIVECDMVFVIVMGHGATSKSTDTAEVIASDNESISTRWIEEQFNNIHCKPLQNKPKIFMYQMCRGEVPDYGTVQSTIQSDSGVVARPSMMILRSCCDMLIAHSTIPGTASHRDVYLGSWYMNLFCEIMMERAHDTHLENIFKLVDAKLAHLRSYNRTMQTSTFTNIGFQTCYVHPGIYLDGNDIKSLHDNSAHQNNID